MCERDIDLNEKGHSDGIAVVVENDASVDMRDPHGNQYGS
jgi:hypothetical protein